MPRAMSPSPSLSKSPIENSEYPPLSVRRGVTSLSMTFSPTVTRETAATDSKMSTNENDVPFVNMPV